MPKYSELIARLPATTPFVPPEALERQIGRPLVARIGANESRFGISPKAVEAMVEAAKTSYFYGDPESLDLRTALAQGLGCGIENISVGSGVDEILGWIVRAFVDAGSPVVTSLGSYPTFQYHVRSFAGHLEFVTYVNFTNDLGGLAEAAQRVKPRLVYLANPDNPTGHYHSAAAIETFRSALPEETVLVLDEAYSDFADDLPSFNNDDCGVIRLRTFSKAHGLAGCRVGYALTCADINQSFDKFRNHFGVNRVGQAGALASLLDADFLRKVIEQVKVGREEYHQLGRELGIGSLASWTNFVAFDCGSPERAVHLRDRLLQRGIFVRTPGIEPLSRLLRVSVGNSDERRIFADAFREETNS
ncbi:MAG TPA: aminotransferase class I/II-fold pyridoxal phosphate-dependent enzyme [Fimbriimonadaceae bacterium]|nr:aminotransferase class I/II-fold pyridoxal phosphate-dependent enzyme [Fimbriimonadaceae bacterium]